MGLHDLAAPLDRFLAAFNNGDLTSMREVLAEDAVAYVTTGDGGEVRLDGAEAYVAAIEAMDLASTSYSVALTQPLVVVDGDRALAMVEVRARRGERTLENYAAYLLRVRDGRISELRMVDAKPAESEAFWSQPG